MSSFSRRFFLVSTAALAGCGFAPAYGPSGAASRLQNSVVTDAPKGRAAYLLVRQFEERLGRGSPARYGLSYAVTVEEEAIAISSSDVTTRYNLLGSVTYALRDLQSGAVLKSGKVDSFTGYSASGSTVATQAAKRDAEERLIIILTDQIVTALTAAAPGLPA